jgi:hypothetical protein
MTESRISPDDMAEMIRLELENAAQAKSDAERMDALRKRIFSQLVVAHTADGTSVNKAEHMARANERYVQAEDNALDAQTRANVSGAKAEGLRLKWETWRTRNATKRAEMNLK